MRTHRKGKDNLKKQLNKFDDTGWERCCLEMKMRILRGDVTLVHQVLDQFLGLTNKVTATIDSGVGEVFGAHLSQVLYGMGLSTVRDVLNVSPIMLYTKSGLGETRTNLIITRCREVLEGKVMVNDNAE